MSIFSFLNAFTSVKKVYQSEVQNQLSAMENLKVIITEKDLVKIPEAVRKYIKYAGWVGKEKPLNARIAIKGRIKMKPGKKWMKLKINQYNFTQKPCRIVHLKNPLIGGRDKYENGKGNMLIKLFSRIKLVDATGKEMNESALITYLNDICILVPAALINENISWQEIDNLSTRVTIQDNGLKVSAILYFNEKNQLINFVTHDRYYSTDGVDNKQFKWSTPLSDYKEFKGIQVATVGKAIWHMEDGDFEYVKINIQQLDYNCFEMK